jgi:hypothetical protein
VHTRQFATTHDPLHGSRPEARRHKSHIKTVY